MSEGKEMKILGMTRAITSPLQRSSAQHHLGAVILKSKGHLEERIGIDWIDNILALGNKDHAVLSHKFETVMVKLYEEKGCCASKYL